MFFSSFFSSVVVRGVYKSSYFAPILALALRLGAIGAALARVIGGVLAGAMGFFGAMGGSLRTACIACSRVVVAATTVARRRLGCGQPSGWAVGGRMRGGLGVGRGREVGGGVGVELG